MVKIFSLYVEAVTVYMKLNQRMIRMVFPNYCSFKYKVPEYEVVCPNCGHREYLGCDQDDLIGTESENLHCQEESRLE